MFVVEKTYPSTAANFSAVAGGIYVGVAKFSRPAAYVFTIFIYV